jgi:5'-phosphate synthase pdxT subunit
MTGILGYQGAIKDHFKHLENLNEKYCRVIDAEDLEKVDRLIIPGGESTVMMKFLKENNLTPSLQEKIKAGLPVWGICAGAIVLSSKIDNRKGLLNCCNVEISRNAFGRHNSSCVREIKHPLIENKTFKAVYIRAPRIDKITDKCSFILKDNEMTVGVKEKNVLLTTFHPELTDDSSFHEYFLKM